MPTCGGEFRRRLRREPQPLTYPHLPLADLVAAHRQMRLALERIAREVEARRDAPAWVREVGETAREAVRW